MAKESEAKFLKPIKPTLLIFASDSNKDSKQFNVKILHTHPLWRNRIHANRRITNQQPVFHFHVYSLNHVSPPYQS